MKVSIAIPAFKGKFLKESIESVLNQTYDDFELIIVDDQSPHHLEDLIGEFSDKRIKYYKNITNQGAQDPSKNWNVCLQYARGEFFCLLCDDDMYEPTFIQEMVNLAEDYPKCNVFRARAKIIDTLGNTIDLYPSSPQWESCAEYIWHNGRKLRKQTISEWMLRTDYVKKCGGYTNLPYAWGSDYISIYRFSLDGGIVSTTKPLVAYRRSEINISTLAHKDSELKMLANKMFEDKVFLLIDENNLGSELKKEVAKHKKNADAYLLSHVSIWKYIYYVRKSSYYHINKRAFIKGIEEKLIYYFNL